MNENVINQGLFYLDWLMDHKKDFQWLVMGKFGQETADNVEWSTPRLLCIAGDFTRYDSYAVKQISRNIELIRYRRFGDDLLMVELVHTPRVTSKNNLITDEQASAVGKDKSGKDQYQSQRIDYRIKGASVHLRELWDAVTRYLSELGDDVQMKELKFYVAFKRIKNFVCMEVYPQAKTVVAYLKVNPDTVLLEEGFTRDVRAVGHFGTGELEVSMRSMEDFVRAQSLFQRAYEGS